MRALRIAPPRLSVRGLVALAALLAAATAVRAQASAPQAPQNVLQLSASGAIEAPQDLLTMRLTTTRDGLDPISVQTQLKTALDSALAQARAAAQPGQMDVRTGQFGLTPRYTRDGKISGWTGTAELILEGRDLARIARTAAGIQTMTVGSVGFALSRQQRAEVEREAQALAVDHFKAKAAELAKSFGFAGYSLREIAVSSNEQVPVPRPRLMAAPGAAEMPVPVEAGKSTVVVTVSGSVQLR